MIDLSPQEPKPTTQLLSKQSGGNSSKCRLRFFSTPTQDAQKMTLADSRVLFLFGVAVVVTALAAGVLGYSIGEREARQKSAVIGTDNRNKKITLEEFQSLLLENDILKSEMASLIQERDIALNNFNLIKNEFQDSKSALDEMKLLNQALTESVQFSGKSLQIVGMNIKRLEGEAFEYRFDVLIPSVEIKTMIPTLTLLNSTSMVEIPLSPKSYDVKGMVTIQGRFIMPDNFTPSQLKLVAVVEDERVVKLYNWNAS